ncbi:MAG: DUF5666 domain-containing protein [Gammaproteobacteria bacterium]
MKRSIGGLLLIGILVFFPGCQSEPTELAEGGIKGTGRTDVSAGAISGFGSVIVNGTRFDTTASTIIVNGQTASESDLDVGFVVRVEGDISAGIATMVEFADSVRGPVSDIAPNGAAGNEATLTVLGQTIVVDDLTNLNNTDLTTLMPGDIVAVSGLRNASNVIVANYLEKRANVDLFAVTGVVSNLDATNKRFHIAQLTVDFSAASLVDLPGGALANGQTVEAVSEAGGFIAATPLLKATTVSGGIVLGARPDDEVEVEGLVTNADNAPAAFQVGGVSVATSSATVFEGGSPNDIVVNARVEVEGEIDAGGLLQALRVIVKPSNEVEIQGSAGTVDLGADTITVLSIVVQVDELTSFKDESVTKQRPFNLTHVSTGDRIEVRGIGDASTVIATRLVRKNPEDDTKGKLGAPVESFDATAETISTLGLVITASEALGTGFELDELEVSQEAFYAELQEGTIIEVEWEPFMSTSQPPKQVTLEREEE